MLPPWSVALEVHAHVTWRTRSYRLQTASWDIGWCFVHGVLLIMNLLKLRFQVEIKSTRRLKQLLVWSFYFDHFYVLDKCSKITCCCVGQMFWNDLLDKCFEMTCRTNVLRWLIALWFDTHRLMTLLSHTPPQSKVMPGDTEYAQVTLRMMKKCLIIS